MINVNCRNLDSSASEKPDISSLRTAMQEVIYEIVGKDGVIIQILALSLLELLQNY